MEGSSEWYLCQAFAVSDKICLTLEKEKSDLSNSHVSQIQNKSKSLNSLLINIFFNFYNKMFDTYKVSCDLYVSYGHSNKMITSESTTQLKE